MKKKITIIVLIITFMLIMGGCKKIESVASTNTPTIAPSTTSTITPTTVPTATSLIESPTDLEQDSLEAYEKFIKNEAKVSFDKYTPKDSSGSIMQDLFKGGSEYTLSEVLDIVTAYYFNSYTTNTKMESIDYSYIDCGKDGVNELALRFNGMDIYCENDASNLVYIIKYIDGRLYLCYYYESGGRSESHMNEYGYYYSTGSCGATNHASEYGFLDKDGNFQFIESTDEESDIQQLSMNNDGLEQIPKVAATNGITDGIYFDTICFDSIENVDTTKAIFYTFYVVDDNEQLIEDTNLYTDSIYKEIFDEALVPFITPDEVSNMILVKEKKVGATAEIKEGAEITWKTLDSNMFSDYVGR